MKMQASSSGSQTPASVEPVSYCIVGWAVQEKAKRGFLEDFRIGLELATTAVFDAVRWLIRKALFMPEKQAFTPLGVERRELQHGAGSNEVQ